MYSRKYDAKNIELSITLVKRAVRNIANYWSFTINIKGVISILAWAITHDY